MRKILKCLYYIKSLFVFIHHKWQKKLMQRTEHN